MEVNKNKLDSTQGLASLLHTYSVGEEITLKIMHDGEEREIYATLEKLNTQYR